MKILLSYVEWKREKFEYQSMDEFRKTLKGLGLDGIELVSCWEDNFITRDLIQGIHLPFFTSWMDYYLKNEDRVIEEFGSMDIARELFANEPEEIYKCYLPALSYASSLGAYSVFHMANCNSLEYLGQNHFYSDKDVIDAGADLVNKLVKEANIKSPLLFENLYVPGLKFTNLALTKRLLEKVDYNNIGFVLDTGHLMCTNEDLETEDEAWDYVDEIIEYNREILPFIKVVHLHGSQSGKLIKVYKENPPQLTGDFYENLKDYYKYVNKIDTHSIVRSKKARDLIEKINPDYLVLEFSYRDRKDMEEKIKRQLEIFE